MAVRFDGEGVYSDFPSGLPKTVFLTIQWHDARVDRLIPDTKRIERENPVEVLRASGLVSSLV